MLVESESFVPPPDMVELLRTTAASIVPDDDRHGNWVFSYAKDHSLRLAFDLEILRRNIDTGLRVLEYGAIPLLLTAALKATGYNVTGVDIAPERFSLAISRLGLNISKCNVETEAVPFADSVFDVVIFNELFEHLRINPIFTMKEACRVLKPGGVLLLSTPNLRSLGGIRNILFRNLSYSCCRDVYDQYKKLDTLGHMGHVREYTTREVSEFLERIGFRVTRIIWRGRYSQTLPQMIVRIAPNLRPFFSVVAVKQ